MSDTKALEDVIQFAIRHGNHDIPLQYAHEASAELEQLKAELDACYTQNEAFRQGIAEVADLNVELRAELEEAKSSRVFWQNNSEDWSVENFQLRAELEENAALREALEDARKVIGESDMELQAAQFRTAHALLRSWLSAHSETKEEK
jgi:predicted RNase H-like nuclease (RuvC/YqgF family)